MTEEARENANVGTDSAGTNQTDVRLPLPAVCPLYIILSIWQCRGCIYRLTDCHLLEEDGVMSCLPS